MDTLRGSFDALDTSDMGLGLDTLDLDAFETLPNVEPETAEAADPTPPPIIGTDERRMQVRAYNFWAGLLEERTFPSIEDLDPDSLPDFGPNSVLLDFSCGIDNPDVAYLGATLAQECDADATDISRLSDVPARSLLSRITDHYMQILANQAPIGFEAEFVNQRGATILYRGILLPFSSDDETIDFIYGVINWKEMAPAGLVEDLLLEGFAQDDGSTGEAVLSETGSDEDADDYDDGETIGLPDEPRRGEQADLVDWADGPASHAADAAAPFADDASDIATDPAAAFPAEDERALGDWLALARQTADSAKNSEERTRASLYDAVSRAYDFALAAFAQPDDFAQLLGDAGLTSQNRAPMTPVVKLVFGADYDKTRLTEYAAVLSWAKRTDIAQGTLATYLAQAEGGLKGVIAEERAFRRAADGARPTTAKPRGPKPAIARKLRAMEARAVSDIAADGEEFALVMVRRTEDGDVVLLGEVPAGTSLVEKAARQLLG